MVEFKDVTKTYHLYKNDRARLAHVIHPSPRNAPRDINASNHLSFQIKKGEAVAFFGSNGAGKSTALKMITGVSYPTSGEVIVNGRVSALLELRAGFDKRLTGRDNLILRSRIMGMSDEEIEERMPDILEFAHLGVFIDQPMRTYSSGMKARLGFAFAVSVDPDILVVDEALSVGDKRFRRKCIKRIKSIMSKRDVTVLFVTHSSTMAQRFCSRGIVLDHGTKVFDGTLAEATAYYDENY